MELAEFGAVAVEAFGFHEVDPRFVVAPVGVGRPGLADRPADAAGIADGQVALGEFVGGVDNDGDQVGGVDDGVGEPGVGLAAGGLGVGAVQGSSSDELRAARRSSAPAGPRSCGLPRVFRTPNLSCLSHR